MTNFYTVVTQKGIEQLNNCINNMQPFNPVKMAVGDSNGAYYEPSLTQTTLKNQKFVGNIYAKGKKGNYLYFDLQIPATEGNYTIREVGLFDKDNNLLAVAKYPETYKQSADGNIEKTINIELQIELSNTAINTIIIDESGNFIKKNELDNYVLKSVKNYNVFCVNTGNTDNNGNPAFLSLNGNVLKTIGSFDITTANGKTYTITDILQLNISNLTAGKYNLFINPVTKTLTALKNNIFIDLKMPSNASVGDFLLNTSKVPFSLNKKTSTSVESIDEVFAGCLEISSQEKNLNLNPYNKNLIDIKNEQKLSIQNMYTTGAISSEEQGYTQLIDIAHSTFDISKFDIVGNPAITNDGIASDITIENTINLNLTSLDVKQELKIIIQGIHGETQTSAGPLFTLLAGTRELMLYRNRYSKMSGQFRPNYNEESSVMYLHDSVVTTNFAPYKFIVAFDIVNNTYSYKYFEDGVLKTQVLDKAITAVNSLSDFDFSNITCKIGGKYGQLKGNIDLKQYSIMVDGQTVFSGNKTGLDVIKPDDYTVVGSPVISNEGVLNYTNATSSNYIKVYENLPVGSNNIRIEYEGIVGQITDGLTSGNTCMTLFKQTGADVNPKFGHFVDGATGLKNMFTIWYNSSGEISRNISGSYFSKVGDHYKVIYSFDTEKVYFELYVNGLLKITDHQLISDLGITALNCYIGSPAFVNRKHNSTLDLNSFKIYVDENLVCQPCLKIPYTESKTGSKIVDASYRHRVQDIYEQYGTALYYTLDELNKNFTLPMGEIYGMIEQKTDKETFKSEISTINLTKMNKDGSNAEFAHIVETYQNGDFWYRLYSDGWIEQGGLSDTFTKGNKPQTITLPFPFLNSNYSVVTGRLGASNVDDNTYISDKANSSFTLSFTTMGSNDGTWNLKIMWQASGYANTSNEDSEEL